MRSRGKYLRRKAMRYIISDIHGCYAEYKELLDKIHLRDDDMLYILGDTLDKGPKPIRAL